MGMSCSMLCSGAGGGAWYGGGAWCCGGACPPPAHSPCVSRSSMECAGPGGGAIIMQ